jgi:hypothetical protein
MPLVSALLEAQLAQTLVAPHPATPFLAARELAKAYDLYAKAAIAGPTSPVFTGAEVNVLASALSPIISKPSQATPVDAGKAWADGVEAYWRPVTFAGTGAGIFQVFTGKASLISGLAAIFAAPNPNPSQPPRQLAQQLDLGTKTVIILVTPPVGPPVPFPLA